MSRRRVWSPRALLPATFLLVVGCGGGPAPGATGPAGDPVASVERFMDAAAAGDLETMGRIFGTADGAHLDRAERSFRCGFRRVGAFFRLAGRCPSPQEVELRMDALARVLEHQAYEVTGQDRVAGRQDPTIEVFVSVDQAAQRVENVPFVAVQGSDGVWYVSQIDVERITGA